MKPLFRWVGGKRRLVPNLLNHIPHQYNTYIEPFAGAAALFFHLEPVGKAVLCDANADLIVAYDVIKHNPKALAIKLSSMPVSREFYYGLRSSVPLTSIDIAARFLYLNRYAVNGMWRVNKDGGMNTPFDHRRSHVRIDGYEFTTDIFKASDVLNLGGNDAFLRTTVVHGNYRNVTKYANTGDLVYMDPPYVPFTANGHVEYTTTGFTWEDHVSLRDEAIRLDKMGVHFVLTNADIPAVRELYGNRGFSMESVQTKASVARVAGQGSYGELIVSNSRTLLSTGELKPTIMKLK